MRVVVTTESRLVRTPDGRVWTSTTADYRFWRRYLSAFDQVRVVARVRDQREPPADPRRVDGEGVEVHAVPYYLGPWQYLRRRRAVRRAVGAAATADDAVILRVPSVLGTLLCAARVRQGLPFAVEVVGDPWDVFAKGVIRHPLRPLLRRRATGRLRRECRAAAAVSYVTESHLQARYPSAPGAPTVAVSSIDLPAEAFVARPRRFVRQAGVVPTIVAVGTLEQMYKGVDTLVLAVAQLAARGVRVRLVHLGDGQYRNRLRRLITEHGVADRVTLAGWVAPGTPLRDQLDRADLFVMPSRTEGLPRALIEAMARALPAIGTRVGGIPELLPAADTVLPGDPSALATAIALMLDDPARMDAASARNLARARQFSREILEPRRDGFYRLVRDAMPRPSSGTDPSPPMLRADVPGPARIRT
ncbi:glycosyltransferase [Micromonospora sp. NPDC051141]|uniref:glycosyltransferase n=1 Tax=Micromonospora sp. NPDC051141 TaxID=3364284 RepID=UPI003798B0BD